MPIKLKALVVDDSRIMRNLVMQALNKSGLAEFEFVEASDGADALTKFDPNEIDMVFADWNMPNMTGVEFVRQARTMGETSHIPMIMVTSEKTMSKIEEALDQAGADLFIIKPFTAEELAAKLQKHVEQVEQYKIDQARAERDQQEQPAGGGFFGRLFG